MSPIRVVGSSPDDYRGPAPRDPKRSRPLARKDVRRLRAAVENLRDVGWRPFGEAGEAWQAALAHVLDAMTAVTDREDSGPRYWIPHQ